MDVGEVYSPPRVTVEAKKFGLKPGDSMDLRTGFDFTIEAVRKRAKQRIRESRPKLLIGSPECKLFSALQNLSRWTVEKGKKLHEARTHEIHVRVIRGASARWQVVLHEHPVGATSWQ